MLTQHVLLYKVENAVASSMQDYVYFMMIFDGKRSQMLSLVAT